MSLKLVKHRPFFQSIQGEGTRAGHLVTFMRLFGCNLDCRWCDTKYSWSPDAPNFGGDMWELGAVQAQLSMWSAHELVITGGEPTLQAKELIELLDSSWAARNFLYITLETNGTRYVPELFKWVDLLSLSPKPWRLRTDKKLVLEMMYAGGLDMPKTQLKMVVENEDELAATVDLFNEIADNGFVPAYRFLIIQPETGKGPEWFGKVVQYARAHLSKRVLYWVRILPQIHALVKVE